MEKEHDFTELNKRFGQQQTKRNYYGFIIFGLGCLLLSIGLQCLKDNPQPKADATYKAAYEAQRKQFGYKQAQFEKELAIRDKADKILRAENAALREQTATIQGNYTTLLKRVRNSAPINCQPYIDSVDTECNKVVVAKDNEIGKLAAIVINQDSIVLKQMDLIGLQTEQLSKDSVHVAALNRHIATLDSEVSQANKRAKWAKFWGKVAIGAAVVYTGVVMYFTVVK